MPGRKSSTSTRKPASPRSVAKKPTPVGKDHALLLSAKSGQTVELSYWDLWFTLVANADFDSNWERIIEHLRTGMKQGFARRLAERKLSHVRDLQRRLRQADVEISDIIAQTDRLPGELKQARNQVLKREPRETEWSDAMRNPPSQRRNAHAMRGFWPDFPVSPLPYAEELASQFQTRGWFSADQSFSVARTLDEFLEGTDSVLGNDQPAQAQAMLRAFLTVVIELMGVADDSYGSLGDTFQDGFSVYMDIALEETGIEDTVFFHDLLTLLIWEDYGLTSNQLDGYFEKIGTEQGELCINYLRQQMTELADDDLNYHYETALTLLGQIVAQQNRFDLFEELATQMGTRH